MAIVEFKKRHETSQRHQLATHHFDNCHCPISLTGHHSSDRIQLQFQSVD
jgi:hypothetical protein